MKNRPVENVFNRPAIYLGFNMAYTFIVDSEPFFDYSDEFNIEVYLSGRWINTHYVTRRTVDGYIKENFDKAYHEQIKVEVMKFLIEGE